jgi:uncharacterized membrane protein YhiD involved in acid resistance
MSTIENTVDLKEVKRGLILWGVIINTYMFIYHRPWMAYATIWAARAAGFTIGVSIAVWPVYMVLRFLWYLAGLAQIADRKRRSGKQQVSSKGRKVRVHPVVRELWL